MLSSYHVLTIGAATRDIFLVSDQFKSLKTKAVVGGIAECVPLGSKIDVQTFYATTGGGATNAAATFRSLGLKTAIICRIGKDETGGDVMNDLKKFHVETRYVNQIEDGQTAYSTLLTMPAGERTVLVFRGVSAKFTDKDIHWSAIRKSKWIYLTSLGGNVELSKKIISFAHKHQVKIAWNPGHGELEKGLKSFSESLQNVNVFIVNKEEAELLTGTTNKRKMMSLLKHESHIRLITDGAKGTTILIGKTEARIGTTGTKGVSKTGAGDAFGSGFVAALIHGKDPLDAAKIGTLNAESVIQHLGAKKGILHEWPTEAKLKHLTFKS